MKTFVAIILTIVIVLVIPYIIGYCIDTNQYGMLNDWAVGFGVMLGTLGIISIGGLIFIKIKESL